MLYPLYYKLLEFENISTIGGKSNCIAFIDSYYVTVVDCLNQSAGLHVPVHYKNYYKFWWFNELSYLKEIAIQSNVIWKDAGRPRSGPIADKRNADKRKYKRQLAIERHAEKVSYTNDLHNALISKSGVNFWKCWRSKFEKKNKIGRLIDGLADGAQIAESFAGFKTCTTSDKIQSNCLRSTFRERRRDYIGDPFLQYKFDVELVETVVFQMNRGKAAGLDELTSEHLINAHPVLIAILYRCV